MKSLARPLARLCFLLVLTARFDAAVSLSSSDPSRLQAQRLGLLAQRGLRHAPTGAGDHEHESGKSSSKNVDVWPGVLMASIAGASTVLGATIILFMPEGGPPPSAMAFSFSLAAGVMIAISVEMLLPAHAHGDAHGDAVEYEGKPAFDWMRVLIFSAGAACCALLCKLADLFESSATADLNAAEADGKPDLEDRKRCRLAVLLFVSLTLHNFPEGFAVAVSALSGLRLGLTMCIAVAFHNIPEGIALAVSVYAATKSYGQSFFWTFLSGLTEPLGAICAMMLIQAYLTSTPDLLVHLLTAVAGVMCYVALAELLPEAISTRCWLPIAAGFAVGVIIMVLTHWVLEASMDEDGHLELQQRNEWGKAVH